MATKKTFLWQGNVLSLLLLSAHLPEGKLWSELAPSRRSGGCREINEPFSPSLLMSTQGFRQSPVHYRSL